MVQQYPATTAAAEASNERGEAQRSGWQSGVDCCGKGKAVGADGLKVRAVLDERDQTTRRCILIVLGTPPLLHSNVAHFMSAWDVGLGACHQYTAWGRGCSHCNHQAACYGL